VLEETVVGCIVQSRRMLGSRAEELVGLRPEKSGNHQGIETSLVHFSLRRPEPVKRNKIPQLPRSFSELDWIGSCALAQSAAFLVRATDAPVRCAGDRHVSRISSYLAQG
jgi:hypothetical protein